MQVTVFHNDIETNELTAVAKVDVSDFVNHGAMEMLEYAYRYTNNIDGSWSKKIGTDANDDVTVLVEREDGLGLRSTMMRDRMELDGVMYEVSIMGFKELEAA